MALQSQAALAEIRDSLLETYASNDAMNQLILSSLDPRAWRAKPPGEKGGGRTIAAIFARNAFRYFAGPHVKITRRRGHWDQADYGEQVLPSYAEMMAPARSRREPDKPREEVDEIELLLRRAAKREAQQRYFSS